MQPNWVKIEKKFYIIYILQFYIIIKKSLEFINKFWFINDDDIEKIIFLSLIILKIYNTGKNLPTLPFTHESIFKIHNFQFLCPQ